MVDIDRERGILAEADRGYLLEKEEYGSRQTRYERRKAIRERVREGLIDFTLLFDELEHDEREKIFGSNLTAQIQLDDNLEAGMRDALAFILEGAGGSTLFNERRPDDVTSERLLERAIKRIGRRYGYFVRHIDASKIDVQAERLPWDLEKGLEEGEELPPEALAHIMEEYDEIDVHEVQELMRSMISDNEK